MKKEIGIVTQEGRFVKVYANGKDVTKKVPQALRLSARNAKCNVELNALGEWVLSGEADPAVTTTQEVESAMNLVKADPKTEDIINFVHTKSAGLKPSNFFISDLKWKYLVRSVMRGRNIMMTGPSGTGKTMAVKHIQESLKRPFFYFNLGSSQDPRSTLIGNTHFKKDAGTYFAQSLFVSAIQTPDAIILLDELSRAHPEAWNIMMTVLDPNQRYLRLDEKDDSPTIKVAEGVSFIATANIGNEYTSTRTMDRALMDRFIVIEMEQLNVDDETRLLQQLYPNVEPSLIKAIAEIAGETRTNIKSESPKVSTAISTRMSVEMASLASDGFTLGEIADVTIYPFYAEEGGLDSERTYMRQVVQKYIKTTDEKLFNSADAVNNVKAPAF